MSYKSLPYDLYDTALSLAWHYLYGTTRMALQVALHLWHYKSHLTALCLVWQ